MQAFFRRTEILALLVLVANPVGATSISFQSTAPVPHPGDSYNFIGGSRDGLNVNDDNGLDGPLNDNFTYVANDRPRQGQTFLTPPGNTGVVLKSFWLRLVGYTDNGTAPEPGYNGMDADFSLGGTFTIRIATASTVGGTLDTRLSQDIPVTGMELNNPAPSGRVTTTNGSGLWMKFTLNPTVILDPGALSSFDITTTSANNRLFEWLGTSSDVYAGGNAYNGDQLGLAAR